AEVPHLATIEGLPAELSELRHEQNMNCCHRLDEMPQGRPGKGELSIMFRLVVGGIPRQGHVLASPRPERAEPAKVWVANETHFPFRKTHRACELEVVVTHVEVPLLRAPVVIRPEDGSALRLHLGACENDELSDPVSKGGGVRFCWFDEAEDASHVGE